MKQFPFEKQKVAFIKPDILPRKDDSNDKVQRLHRLKQKQWQDQNKYRLSK